MLFSRLTEAFYRTINERTPLLGSVEEEDAHSHTGADQYYSPEGTLTFQLNIVVGLGQTFFKTTKI